MTIENARPVIGEPVKPDKCIRHYQFEIYVRQILFPQARYDLVIKKPGETAGEDDSSRALIEPRFKLKSRFSELMFYVEAKYLPEASDPMVEWCEPSEFKRYRELDDELPVYILIGEGPRPAEPDGVYLFPVKNVRYNRVLRSHLEKYSIPTCLEIFGKDLISMRLMY